MYKWISLSVALIVLSISTPAQADLLGLFSSNGGPQAYVDGHDHMPSPQHHSTMMEGSKHGYPFYSGCCESSTSCCQGLWDNFCSRKGGGGLHHGGHGKGGCDPCCGQFYGHRMCGCAGGCGHAGLGFRSGHKGWGGKGGHMGVGGKGGCGPVADCDPCQAKKGHGRLFHKMHFGHGCDTCAPADCGTCNGGSKGYAGHSPLQHGGHSLKGDSKGTYDNYSPTYDAPQAIPGGELNQPAPGYLPAPTPISDRSARTGVWTYGFGM